jgi:hypothetical protein
MFLRNPAGPEPEILKEARPQRPDFVDTVRELRATPRVRKNRLWKSMTPV